MKKSLYVNKTIRSLIIFDIVQVTLVIGIILFNYSVETNSIKSLLNGEHLVLFFVLCIVFINSFLTIKDVQSLYKDNNSYDLMKHSLQQVEALNNTLRAQRHDFMNHLQVVHGLIDMEEFDEAKEYIQRVFEDIQRVNIFLKTANPAVNALLQAKIMDAERKNIKVVLNIKSTLKNIKIPSWELCRVMGNILDNSIYVLKDVSPERLINIEIFEDLTDYVFEIQNNGPEIPREIITKIFEAGFTTKSSEGQGMGLFICKDILSEYGGDITVTSNSEITKFKGWFKK